MEESSVDTDWKNIEIWSEDTKSGNFFCNSEIKSRKSLNSPGTSMTKAWSWVYKIGMSQIKIAAPVTINIEKVISRERFDEILKDSIFFWRPTNKYATTILIKNGVKTEPKKLTTTMTNNITKEKTIVSSLLNIFVKKLFNCSNIFYF